MRLDSDWLSVDISHSVIFWYNCPVLCVFSQEIASLKRQFAELLSDIGFVKDGLKARVIEKMSSKGSDGVLETTGYEVTVIPECWDKNNIQVYVLKIIEMWKDNLDIAWFKGISSLKNLNSVIYLSSCRSKPVWVSAWCKYIYIYIFFFWRRLVNKQLMIAIDFHSMEKLFSSQWSQWLPSTVW